MYIYNFFFVEDDEDMNDFDTREENHPIRK